MSHPPPVLLDLATAALANSYSPYSHFPVGCAIKTAEGNTFAGTNVENPSYGATLCAEASAIGAMLTQGDKSITDIVIVIPGEKLCPPCGICRQRLLEFSTHDTIVHLCTTQGKYKKLTMNDLMPYPFGSEFLETS